MKNKLNTVLKRTLILLISIFLISNISIKAQNVKTYPSSHSVHCWTKNGKNKLVKVDIGSDDYVFNSVSSDLIARTFDNAMIRCKNSLEIGISFVPYEVRMWTNHEGKHGDKISLAVFYYGKNIYGTDIGHNTIISYDLTKWDKDGIIDVLNTTHVN